MDSGNNTRFSCGLGQTAEQHRNTHRDYQGRLLTEGGGSTQNNLVSHCRILPCLYVIRPVVGFNRCNNRFSEHTLHARMLSAFENSSKTYLLVQPR